MLTDKERAEIRRKMMELTEEPPAHAWKAIHAEIKPRRRWRFAWWITGAVLLLVTVAGVFFVMDYKSGLERNAPTASLAQPKAESATPTTKQAAQPTMGTPQANTKPAVSSPKPDRQIEQNTGNPAKEIEPLASNIPGKSLPSENVPAVDQKNAPSENIPGRGKDTIHTPANAVLENNNKITPELQNTEKTKEAIVQVRPNVEVESLVSQPKQSLESASDETITEKKSPGNAEPIPVTGKTPISTPNTVIVVKPERSLPNEKPTENGSLLSAEEKSGNTVPGKLKDTEDTKTVVPNQETIAFIPSGVLHANESIYELTLDSVSLAERPDAPVVKSEEKKSIIIPERKQPIKEWTLGVFLSPRYAYRVITPASSDDIYITGLNNNRKSGADRMGYEAGVNLSKTIGRNLYLETSLAFMQLKENLSYTYTTGVIDTLLRTVSADGQQVEVNAVYVTSNRQLNSSYVYGGWRIGASYYFWQNHRRRFNITANGGVNLLVKGQTREIIDGQESKTLYFPSKENILEQTNYNLQVGAGYSVRVMQKYELMLMPTLNYFLGSTFKTREPFGLKPYSLGIHIQLKRRFPL